MKTPLMVSLAKLVLFFGCALIACNSQVSAAPGDLDPTFGVGGKVTTAIGVVARTNAIALQADGKFVVVGYYFASGPPLMYQTNVLVRYNGDGSLDTSFNGTGIKNAPIYGTSVAVQSDGKILVAGGDRNGFALARYNANGSVDFSVNTDFGVNGNSGLAESVAVQSDGKIVVAGTTGRPDFAVARYNDDGSLDTTFGGTGKVTTSFDTAGGGGKSVAVQSDGKIVVAGYASPAGGNPLGLAFALVRYNTNGSIDFKTTTDFGSGDDSGKSVALQPDGKILVAGTSYNGNTPDFALVRYNSNGRLDTTFNGTGKATTDFGSYDDANGVALQPDGKIVVAGGSYNGNERFQLARYNSNGTLDTFFNGTGKVSTLIGKYSYGKGLVMQSDGNFVVVGDATLGSSEVFALARYEGDPDTDGDGIPDRYETGTGIYVSPEDTGTSATNPDSDGDGLNDGEEVRTYHSNPNLKDTDYDGFEDGFEVATGFSPTSAESTPDALSSIRTAAEYRFNAALGVSYRIEASTDLANWTTIEPNITGTGGVITRFYSVEGQPKRFFRSRRN